MTFDSHKDEDKDKDKDKYKDKMTKKTQHVMHCRWCTAIDAPLVIHGRWCPAGDKPHVMQPGWCIAHDALQVIRCRWCTAGDARQVMHCRWCTPGDATRMMHGTWCTAGDAPQVMHRNGWQVTIVRPMKHIKRPPAHLADLSSPIWSNWGKKWQMAATQGKGDNMIAQDLIWMFWISSSLLFDIVFKIWERSWYGIYVHNHVQRDAETF